MMSLSLLLSSPLQNPSRNYRTIHPNLKNPLIFFLPFKHPNPSFPMAPLPLRIGINPQSRTLTLNPLQALRPFSSSSPPFPDQPPNPSFNGESNDDASSSPPRSSPASMFNDIKEKLRSQQAPPRRIPNDPPPPPIAPPGPSPAVPFDEIRKRLAEFRSRPSSNPNPSFSPTRGPSEDRPTSFQELFKRNANSANPQDTSSRMSYETMRESIGKIRPSTDPRRFQSLFSQRSNASGPSLIGDQENLPESIFGREMREKEGGVGGEGKELKTELVKMYGDEELGEKLRRLRPEAAGKGKKDWFSLDELNLRLAKLRELEESESKSKRETTLFSDLRKSLMKLKHSDDSKKANNANRLSIISEISSPTRPSFMNKPPQEHLLENYFHPDHMSSSEKMKLELKKVRDEFKMSESDCGSARVQIAQLTTKIKHLSSALHKKDKHSRKGLNEMVQRRKKLLKYLRRTDWDSYCFVLTKLGLRDTPEYKVPDYKV